MANIIIKSDERRENERYVASQFGIGSGASSEQRDAVEIISRRTEEAIEKGRREERRYTR